MIIMTNYGEQKKKTTLYMYDKIIGENVYFFVLFSLYRRTAIQSVGRLVQSDRFLD